MTSGHIIRDLTVPTQQYDVDTNTGVITNISVVPIGFYWEKTWSGTDYPTSRPSKTTKFWWNRRFDSHGMTHYFKVWDSRYPPKRVTDAYHPYSMTLVMESNSLAQFSRPLTHSIGFRQDVPTMSARPGRISSSIWDSNDDLALIGKLRDRIAGSDFNMAVFLGEGHEALTMITKNATMIYNAYKHMRKLDLIGAADALGVRLRNKRGAIDLRRNPKDIANRWLELQYGWLPLLKDVQGGAEFLSQILHDPFAQRYRVRRKKPLGFTISSLISSGNDYTVRGETVGQLDAHLKEVNPVALSGLLDPLSLAWELLPYSFVADWFIPIGGYLAARGLASSLTGTFVTTKTERYRMWIKAFGNAPNQVMVSGPNYRYQRITLDRTVSSSLSVPFPSVKPFGKIASWKHCANAVALLVNQFGSAKR